jgi:Fe-S cluster biogenesis protein NfuA
MASSRDEREFRKRVERMEELLREVERFADPGARAHTTELVRAVLDLHGAALERMLQRIAEAPETGLAMIDTLARDDLVGSLLLLYGLHPLDLPTRVRQALDKVRPYLRLHGGNVELLGVVGGAVRLRMQGSCHGCESSAQTLKLAIEEAIYDKAPDVTAIEVDESVNGHPVHGGGARLALPVLHG